MGEENKKKRGKIWHLQVSDHLNEKLEEYIELDSFSTKSEFIREAVRERLEIENEKLGQKI